MKVLHIPCYSRKDPLPTLQKNLDKLSDYESITLTATAQHMDRLDDIIKTLEENGKIVYNAGQVLGCRQEDVLESDTDCILYVGSGRFHPLGIALKTEKPVYMLNPLSEVVDIISDDEKTKWIRKRKGAIMRALEAYTYGIMVSTKDGQMRFSKALEIAEKIRRRGKKAFIFAADELNPPNLLPFKVDVWINTACPRLSQDIFQRPVIESDELIDFIDRL
jgi:2-(3-amino-3-carboxypropyl)histidine synthase